MKSLIAIATTLALLLSGANLNAQELFGSGSKSPPPEVERNFFGQPKTGNSMITWPQFWQKKPNPGFEKTPSETEVKSGWLNFNPFNSRKASPDSEMGFYEDSRPSYSLPKWWQRSDPTQPTKFQTFNANTAEFWGKTSTGVSNWARETNAKMKARTFDTWDTITRGFSRKPLGQAPKPNSPPLRSARNRSDEPRVRF